MVCALIGFIYEPTYLIFKLTRKRFYITKNRIWIILVEMLYFWPKMGTKNWLKNALSKEVFWMIHFSTWTIAEYTLLMQVNWYFDRSDEYSELNIITDWWLAEWLTHFQVWTRFGPVPLSVRSVFCTSVLFLYSKAYWTSS